MKLQTNRLTSTLSFSRPGRRSLAARARTAAGLLLVLLAVASPALAPHAMADTLRSSVAATAEDALRQAAQLQGAAYASDCASARAPADLGQLCSKLVARQGDVQAYLTGFTFSEFQTWVFVEQTGGGWRLLGTAPYDDSATSLAIPWPSN